MRVPVAVTLESRDGTVSKDAKVLNGVVETKGDQSVLRKRPGVSDLGQIWTTGKAQLLYPWNGLWAIYGDTLFTGTQSTILSPAFTAWNPSDKGSDVTLSNSNLTAAFSNTVNVMVRASNSRSSGKFYWEVTIGTASANGPLVGIAKSTATLSNYLGQDANGWAYQANGNKINNASGSAYGSTFTTGDIIGVALDLDNGTLSFYKNGVSQGTAYSSLSGTFYPAASGGTTNANGVTANFGATAFTYTPPTGFTAGFPTTGTSLGPTTGGLRFDAQEVGASASTQRMMIKNRTQAWTIDSSGAKTAISFPSSMGAVTYSVSSLTRSGTTATASLATDSNLNVGDSITVAGAGQAAYNGTFSVTAVTSSATSPSTNITISSLTRSGTTATAVTSTSHGLTSGNSYTIGGANQSEYNGSKTITVVDTTTFTYTVTVTPGTTVTWDPANKSSHVTLSGGNLTAAFSATFANGAESVLGTAGKTSGKWYWEITINSVSMPTASATIGVGTNVGSANGATASTLTPGDVWSVALDRDSNKAQVYKNNVLQSTSIGLTGTIYPSLLLQSTSSGGGTQTLNVTVNFGATAFTYTPPSGFQSLQTDSPITPATGSPYVTRPGTTTPATVSYTVSGSPTTPATGTITISTSGGMVPGIPYIDGYFFVMDNNGVMWHSSIDDPTSWPALNFLTAQNENGGGKALAKSLNYLIAFKEWSTEFFCDGHVSPGFAFLPVDNGFTQVGCASGDSLAHIDSSLLWLSQVKERGRSVHLMSGLQQQKVSTADVERILNNDDLATVYAFGLKIGGHGFYVLTLVTSNISLVYDLGSQSWSHWSSLTAGNALTVSSITRSDTTATVTTSTAHGLSDGDPITLAGANQNEYNGTFQISYISSTQFSIQVSGSPLTPATGTITATPYTASYFKFTKYCDYQGLNLFLHETNGHLYQMLPTLYQDAGNPIDLFFRTTRLDGGSTEVKVMSRLTVIGDKLSDTMVFRHSDDDCNTFSAYRPVDLSLERPSLRRLGKFRRRTIEGRHAGNTSPRIEAIELEVPQ